MISIKLACTHFQLFKRFNNIDGMEVGSSETLLHHEPFSDADFSLIGPWFYQDLTLVEMAWFLVFMTKLVLTSIMLSPVYTGCSLIAETCFNVHKMIIFWALRSETLDLEISLIYILISTFRFSYFSIKKSFYDIYI